MNQNSKSYNLGRMIQTIRNHGDMTIDELAHATHVPRPTVYRLVNQLLGEGVVQRFAKQDSGLGRKPCGFALNSAYRYILGVNIDKYYIKTFISDMKCRIIVKWSYSIDSSITKEQILEALDSGVAAVMGNSETSYAEEIGVISLGVTAAIASNSETIHVFNQHECLNGFNIVKYMRDKYHIHTILAKSSTLRTIAYINDFSLRGVQDYVYAYIGTGIGAGIVIGGKLFRGSFGGAGEFAGAPVYGSDDTFEGVYSLSNLYRKILSYRRSPGDPELEDKLSLLDQLDMEYNQRMILAADYCLAYGRADIREEVLIACREWGKLCSIMVAFYDPQILVIGGEVSNRTPNIYKCICDNFRKVSDSHIEIMPANASMSWDELIAENSIDYLVEKIGLDLSTDMRGETKACK